MVCHWANYFCANLDLNSNFYLVRVLRAHDKANDITKIENSVKTDPLLFPENRAIWLPIFKSEWLTFAFSGTPEILLWPRAARVPCLAFILPLANARITDST